MLKESNDTPPKLRLPPTNKALRRQIARLSKVAVEHIRSASGLEEQGRARAHLREVELTEAEELNRRGRKFVLAKAVPSTDIPQKAEKHSKILPPLTQFAPPTKNVMSTTSLPDGGAGLSFAYTHNPLSAKNSRMGKTRDVSYILDQCQPRSPGSGKADVSKFVFSKGQVGDVTAGYPQSLAELRAFRDQLEKTYRPDGVSEIMKAPDVLLKYDIFKQVPNELYNKSAQFFANSMSVNRLRDAVGPSQKSKLEGPTMEKRKRECDLGVPSSRSDAIALLKWFDKMIEKLASETRLEGEERFNLAQTIYYICYKELVRQTAVHCAERGSVMQKLWQAYATLIKEMCEAHGKSLQFNRRKCEEEFSHVQVKQRSDADALQRRCEELATIRFRLEDELRAKSQEIVVMEENFQAERQGWEKDNEQLRAKVAELDMTLYKYDELSKEFEEIDRKCKAAKRENDRYKMLLAEAQRNPGSRPPAEPAHENAISAETQTAVDLAEAETQCEPLDTTETETQTEERGKGTKSRLGKTLKKEARSGSILIESARGELPKGKLTARDFAGQKEDEKKKRAATVVLSIAKSVGEIDIEIEKLEPISFTDSDEAGRKEEGETGNKQENAYEKKEEGKEEGKEEKKEEKKEEAADWMQSVMAQYSVPAPQQAPRPVKSFVPTSIEPIKLTVLPPKIEDAKKKPKESDSVSAAPTSQRPATKSRRDLAAVPKVEVTPALAVTQQLGKPSVETVDEGVGTFSEEVVISTPRPHVKHVPAIVVAAEPGHAAVLPPQSKVTETIPQAKKEEVRGLVNPAVTVPLPTPTPEVAAALPPTAQPKASETKLSLALLSVPVSCLVKRELVEVKSALSEKARENLRLKEYLHELHTERRELERETKRLAEVTDENNKMDVENYKLKESVENIKERIMSLEQDRGKLKETIAALEKGGNKPAEGQARLIGQIKDLCDTQDKLKTDLVSNPTDASFLRESESSAADNKDELRVPLKGLEMSTGKERAMLDERSAEFVGSPNHFKFVEFRLGRRKKLMKKSNARMIQELKENAMKQNKNVQPFPRKMLLKMISYFYSGMLGNSRKSQQGTNFVTFAYGELMNKYGLKNVADRKFLQILVACIANKGLPRVRMFGRFLGLYDEYTNDELRCYLDLIELIRSLSATLKAEIYETDERQYAGYTVALECAKLYFEKQLPASEWVALKSSLDSTRVADTRGKNPAGLVEIDLFAEQVISQYAKLSQKATDTVADLFIAADVCYIIYGEG